MSFFSGTTSLTAARSAATPARTPTRSDLLGRQYQPFSNPFFDHANTYMPTDISSLFRYCQYYHMTHGIINAIATRASEYSVTDLIVQHKDSGVRERWEELLLGSMNYRVLQYEINLDYNVMGNAFVSLHLPFRKYIICGNCGKDVDAIQSRNNWRYSGHKFWLTCEKCGQSGYAKSMDRFIPNPYEIGLIRWNPQDVSINYNEATGRCDYILRIPSRLQKEIEMGKKETVATVPDLFLQATKEQVSIVFDPNEVFHVRRPNISTVNRGWGLPMLMPVLKDAFYMQIMKKANEAVLLEHILPQSFIYPQPATAGADPFVTVDLTQWRDHLRAEIARQRMDPAYTAIVPFPVGHQTIGGQGRSLLLMPEIQQIAEHITVGMGFPSDLVFGNSHYAGTTVSMRMLENQFLSLMHGQHRLVDWVTERIGAFLNWPKPEARFKPFSRADDIQRASFMLQLNQMKKVSDTTLLSLVDRRPEDESALMAKEVGIMADGIRSHMIAEAELQNEVQKIQHRGTAEGEAIYNQTAQREAAKQQTQQQPTPFPDQMSSGLSGPGGMTLENAMAVDQMIQSGDFDPPPQTLPPRE